MKGKQTNGDDVYLPSLPQLNIALQNEIQKEETETTAH